VDDAAAVPGCDHLRREGLCANQRTGQVYGEHAVPGFEVDVQ
jgi:hypothetical protein